MASARTQPRLPAKGITSQSTAFAQRLREIAMFFDSSDRVHQTMQRVAAKLQAAGAAYAIVGGMAVNAHHHGRTTQDVDFLVTAAGLQVIRQLAAAGEFSAVPGRARRFHDLLTGVTFDLLIAGQFPGSGDPGPIAFPDPAAVGELVGDLRIANLATLIELKLAAGRYQDFADVVSLIRANTLTDSFGDRLHPSVQADYLECLQEMRRENEYEARRDRGTDPPS